MHINCLAVPLAICTLASTLVLAQSARLPPASRTAFKCTVAGKVSYSDEPCAGAQRIDLEPTRGLDKSTGRAMTGTDVRREYQREQLAEAVKPITGMDARQFEVQRRRAALPPGADAECRRLDLAIARAEASEAAATGDGRRPLQAKLFSLRMRFHSLAC